MQAELQKQMTVSVSVPVGKEGKRLEVAMGQRMEKVLKAHVDAMWARLAEENAKREKAEKERLQQITTLLNNFFSKEMPAVIERGMKKEFLALIPTISQAILPPIQKAISTGISESFQKGIADKLLPQLEKLILTKLEVSISRQLQTQFQTVGKQALQDAIRSSFEGYIMPTFEHSCRTMFEHVDSVFKRGMEEHVVIAQQQFSSMHSPLASILQETVMSASGLAQSLRGELAENNKRLAALVETSSLGTVDGSNRNESAAFLDKILSLQHVEEKLDPTVKLTKFLKEDKLEEAFHMALSADNVDLVTWLCNQVDPMVVLQRSPLPLGQTVLLSLVQQLGAEIEKDTKGKLRWIQEAVLSLNPKDPTVASHVRSILEQVLSNLQRQTNIAGPGDLSNQMRLVTHVVNSMLTACK
jgi:enhancer of mRNA-decapping protein 4